MENWEWHEMQTQRPLITVTLHMHAIKWVLELRSVLSGEWLIISFSSSDPRSNQKGNDDQTTKEMSSKENEVLLKIFFCFNQQNILLSLPSLLGLDLVNTFWATAHTSVLSVTHHHSHIGKTDSNKYGTAKSWTGFSFSRDFLAHADSSIYKNVRWGSDFLKAAQCT